ncbi:hypothetical protein, partial [Bradyrhizobium sp. UFLA05-112]
CPRPRSPNHGCPWIQNFARNTTVMLETAGRDVRLHRTIQAFLAAVSQNEITILEKDRICDAIVEIVTPKAQEIAAERTSRESGHLGTIKRFELSDAKTVTIKGYATPKQSIVAVTFEVSFDLMLFRSDESGEQQVDTSLSLEGSCSYNPASRDTSDLLVSTWHHSLKGHTGTSWSMHSAPGSAFERQLKETRYI